MRIFLTGFMGCGKTTVGKLLADRLGLAFVDLDSEVEKQAGLRVRQVFEGAGEIAFRQLERRALRRSLTVDQAVIATGGGTFIDDSNRRLISEAGTSVWLNPPFEVLASRLRAQEDRERPLFDDTDQARNLFRNRLQAYRQADIEISIDEKERPEQVVSRILSHLCAA
jgi:shikimate kinase